MQMRKRYRLPVQMRRDVWDRQPRFNRALLVGVPLDLEERHFGIHVLTSTHLVARSYAVMMLFIDREIVRIEVQRLVSMQTSVIDREDAVMIAKRRQDAHQLAHPDHVFRIDAVK